MCSSSWPWPTPEGFNIKNIINCTEERWKKNPHLEVDHRFVKTTNLLSILVGILYYKQQK